MKTLVEYIRESIIDSTNSGRDYYYNRKEQVAKEVVRLFVECFSNVVDIKNPEITNAFGPIMDFNVTVKTDSIDFTDKESIEKSSKAIKKVLVKKLNSNFEEFSDKLSEIYDIKVSFNKKPNKKYLYMSLRIDFENDFVDWSGNKCILISSNFYYDPELDRTKNTISLSTSSSLDLEKEYFALKI
jgi:hypothetical protein